MDMTIHSAPKQIQINYKSEKNVSVNRQESNPSTESLNLALAKDSAQKATSTKEESQSNASNPSNATNEMKLAAEIRRLVVVENHVKQHEAAHMAVGGEFAGTASYSYTTGPDGKRYISGGEVSISIPSTDDKKEAIRMLEQVKRAALAPADPSAQDQSTAASASAKQSALRAELKSEKFKQGNK